MSTRTANGDEVPWYRPVADECEVFERAHALRTPLLLKGPTGCGKSRLVEHMAARLGRPLVTVACHDETSAVDLTGRYLLEGGDTVWQDGPVTRAVRSGAILYLDEFAEARSDVVVVVHPLADHRRQLHLDRRDETLEAPDEFMLVVSFNPGYQRGLKELKPSTRQRFVALSFDYPEPEVEREILIGETGVGADHARRLVALAGKLRGLETLGLAERPSTRLLVNAARLLEAGSPPRAACDHAIVEALTDDPEVAGGLRDLVALVF
ncbi:MAG: CbbQ/NirQ/NorQ/GpvN family protein [Spirochaetaceae bacterium]|nr:CbbQ/NirQ/NorQ/GpvN family protein [Myxococcales bacterium]MCB9726609.1 CbbQ/NirQ/NorQ/GpvN family protein [Spirochaetaceae bacterium]HPG25845.1 CbbQ/NirQ/NorQ/GpvN family protein [Myxococcota bacterium]